MSANKALNAQIAQEAAEWAEELDHGPLSEAQCRGLADWLLKSPEHVSELLLAATLFRAFDELDHDNDISIEALLSDIAPDVIPLMRETQASGMAAQDASIETGIHHANIHPPFWRRTPIAVMAASLLSIIAVGLLVTLWDRSEIDRSTNIIATVVGEQRSVPLDDGSVVHLNTASSIRVRFEDGFRHIDLLRGEAMFQVAHMPDNPFRVYAGDTVTEALGTTFNVYHTNDQTTVAVIEGKVAVETIHINGIADKPATDRDNAKNISQLAEADTRLTLTAGKRVAVLSTGHVATDQVANMETVTSWRLRKLIFERETLDTIVREYNRYGKMKIYIDDPALANTRFTGIFDADDPESLLSFLDIAGGLHVERRSRTEVRIQGKMHRDG